jgi:NAD(P)-dependent dehydrogenase (short-subunit alcohol dehydrogenase family)
MSDSNNGPTGNHNRTALVTGGSSGIGFATAQQLLADGYRVAICARDRERLDRSAKLLGDVVTISADLASWTAASSAVEQAVKALGRLDVLVNAHGLLGEPTPLPDVKPELWDEILGANLRGPIATTTAAVPALKETRGAIVNVASINAIQSEPWMAPYGVSKGGLVAFTKYAAADLAELGIRVNAVLPGWVRTPMAMPYLEQAGVRDAPMATNYMRRAAEPAEIAHVIAFLASPRASYMTGSCVVVDGGHWIKMTELAPASTPLEASSPEIT